MPSPPRLIVATRNAHKTEEIREVVGSRFEVMDATDFSDWPIINETGTTFLENARLKALGISEVIDGWVLSDQYKNINAWHISKASEKGTRREMCHSLTAGSYLGCS